MKPLTAFLLLAVLFTSCSKISQERLEGTWQLAEVREIPTDVFDVWEHWLDTTEVKVAFLDNGAVKVFYFEGSSLVGFGAGNYVLMEDEEKLLINDTSLVFNPHGLPLDITSLKKNKMTLEGRYYVHGVNESLPVDSFVTLRWTLEK